MGQPREPPHACPGALRTSFPEDRAQGPCCPWSWDQYLNLKEQMDGIFSGISHDLDELNNKTS